MASQRLLLDWLFRARSQVGANLRRAAVDFDVPLLNNFVCTRLFVDSLEKHHANPFTGVEADSLFEFYKNENPEHKWVEGEFH